MALQPDVIRTTYPLPAYNYKVTFGTRTMSFSEVSGLNIEYEKVVYKHGFSHVMGSNIIRAQKTALNITLKRGLVAHRKDLYEWLINKGVQDISIELCDEKGNAVIKWLVSRAKALKIEGPSLNAGGNEVAIETVELTAHNLTVEYL